jgi:AbrB family looped-hinge helix DNA binding protein
MGWFCRLGLPKREGSGKKYLHMTSNVSTKGQTVIPKTLRKRYGIGPGSTLDWSATADGLRVVKLAPRTSGGFLQALRRIGRVPAAPRDLRPIRDPRP